MLNDSRLLSQRRGSIALARDKSVASRVTRLVLLDDGRPCRGTRRHPEGSVTTMTKDRASVFDSGDAGLLDVSSFKPKTAANADAVPVAHLRAIAEASQFPSREPPKSGPARRARFRPAG
jgi:hypothetical protein